MTCWTLTEMSASLIKVCVRVALSNAGDTISNTSFMVSGLWKGFAEVC